MYVPLAVRHCIQMPSDLMNIAVAAITSLFKKYDVLIFQLQSTKG
jgi:hypothetical protein